MVDVHERIRKSQLWAKMLEVHVDQEGLQQLRQAINERFYLTAEDKDKKCMWECVIKPEESISCHSGLVMHLTPEKSSRRENK